MFIIIHLVCNVYVFSFCMYSCHFHEHEQRNYMANKVSTFFTSLGSEVGGSTFKDIFIERILDVCENVFTFRNR